MTLEERVAALEKSFEKSLAGKARLEKHDKRPTRAELESENDSLREALESLRDEIDDILEGEEDNEP